MKHLVDLEHGSLVLIPETDSDNRLLFHLMNCSDLSQFTRYLDVMNKRDIAPITTDLGVTVKNLEMYPCATSVYSSDCNTFPMVSDIDKLSGITSDMDFPPDFEFKPLGELTLYNNMIEPEQVIDFRKGTGETFLPASGKSYPMKTCPE